MTHEDDEDDQAASIGVGRYPCMPSLVALQQMRNRLHLANLGKKLMKWSALATGRELRKIGYQLIESYGDFKNEIADAFLLLARCRYFYPNLNKMVVEDKQKKASLAIITSSQPISAGVRRIAFEIVETNEPYLHLGIEKGGQTIREAKRAWADLLKKMILILQLRVSFEAVDYAHKSASKKQNVLGKIIIPKINITLKYITDELEEIEREDNFRLKTFKRSKIRKEKEKMGGDALCTCCMRIFDTNKAMTPDLMLCDICSKVKNINKVIPKKPVICKNITEEVVQYMDEHLEEIKEWAMSNSDNVFMKPCCFVERKVLVETCECPEERTASHEACLDSCSKPCNVHCSCVQTNANLGSEAPRQSKEHIIIPVSKPSKLEGQLVVILIPKQSAVIPSIAERQISPQENAPRDRRNSCVSCQSESSLSKHFKKTHQPIDPKIIPDSGTCGAETYIEARFIPPPTNIDGLCQANQPLEPETIHIHEPSGVKPYIAERVIPPSEVICVSGQSEASILKHYKETLPPTEPQTIPTSGPCGVETCIAKLSISNEVCEPCQSETASLKPCEVKHQPMELKIIPMSDHLIIPQEVVCEPRRSEVASSKPCEVVPQLIEHKVNLSSGSCGVKTCIEAHTVPPPKTIYDPCQPATSSSKPCKITRQLTESKIVTCDKSTSDHATSKLEYICSSCQSKASVFIPYQQKIFTPVKLRKIPSIELGISTCSGNILNQDITSIQNKRKEISTNICEQNSDHNKLEPRLDVQNKIGQTDMNYGKYVEKVIEIKKTINIDGTIDIEKKITIRSKNLKLNNEGTLPKDLNENDDQNLTIDSNITFTGQSRSRFNSSCMPSGDLYTLCSCSESQHKETKKNEQPKSASEFLRDDGTNTNNGTRTFKINDIKSEQNKASPQMYNPKIRYCMSDSIFESKTMNIAKKQMIADDDDNSSNNEKGKHSKHFVEICLVSNRKREISSKNILETKNDLQFYGTFSDHQYFKHSKSMELTGISKETVDFSSVGIPKLGNVESNTENTNKVSKLGDSSNIELTIDKDANIATEIQGALPAKINKPKPTATSKRVKSEPDETSLDLKTIKLLDPINKTLHENDTTFKLSRKVKSDLLVPVTRWKQNKTNEDVSEAKQIYSFNDITTRLAMCKECLMELSGYVPTKNNSRKMSQNCTFCQMRIKKATQKKNETIQQSRNSSFYSCTSVFINSYSHTCIDLENSHISIKLKKPSYFPTTQEKRESGKNDFKVKAYIKDAMTQNLPDSERTNIQLDLAHHDSQTATKQTKSSDSTGKMDAIRYHVVSKKATERITNTFEKQLQVDSLLSQIYNNVISSSTCSMKRHLYHKNRNGHQNTLHKKCTYSHETYMNPHCSLNPLPDDNTQNSTIYNTSFELRNLLHEDKNISTTPVSSSNASVSFVSSYTKKIYDLKKAYDNMYNLLKVESIGKITDKVLYRDTDQMYKPSKNQNIIESNFHLGFEDTGPTVLRQRSLIEEKEDCVIEYEDCTSSADSEEDCKNYEDACVGCNESYKDPISNLIWCQTPSCSINKNGFETETQSKEVCTNNLIRDRKSCSKNQKSCNKSTNQSTYVCERVDACTNTKRNNKYDVRSLSNFPKLLKKPNISLKSGLSKSRKQNMSKSHHYIMNPKKRCKKISKPCNSCSDLLSSEYFTLDVNRQQ